MNNLERIRRAPLIAAACALIIAPYAAPIFLLSLLLAGPADSGWPVTYRSIGWIVYCGLACFTAALCVTFDYLIYGGLSESFSSYARWYRAWPELIVRALFWPLAWLELNTMYRRHLDMNFALALFDVVDYWLNGTRRIPVRGLIVVLYDPPSNDPPA